MILKRSGFLVAVSMMVLGLFVSSSFTQTSVSTKKSTAKRKAISRTRANEKVLYAERDERERKLQGGRSQIKGEVKTSHKATPQDSREIVNSEPVESKLLKAGSFNGDLRELPYKRALRIERPEHESPGEEEIIDDGDPVPIGLDKLLAPTAAPAPTTSFAGLGLPGFGAGYPPDTVGDVGPNHYIQGVNTHVGIFDKATGTRLVGLTMNSFMSAGAFGNLCDTNNFGDPVILYDSFEDRWIVTDFAFTLDGSGNVTSNSFQCFAVSKTGDPVSGGWNYYFTVFTDGLGDYPKFGVWPDGIYWSANMFGFSAGGSFQGTRVVAMNKAQMYAGAPTVQVVTFNPPSGEFTILPANARLQTGTPPAGSPNYFSVVWQFSNAISVYKFAVDWNKISTSTFTGPSVAIAPASWSSAPASVSTLGGNAIQTLQPRLMMQNQYLNIGGVESLWNSHTVLGAAGQAAPRFYQVTVTGGTVAGTTTQAFTHAPDAAISRFMPSLALDKNGNMLMGYSASNSAMKPALRWAGRLSTDAVNSLPQTETSLIEGAGTQTNNCGGAPCTRWGDYSAMSLDPNGCSFWYTGEYYAADGGNWQTRIGATAYPTCVPSITGTLQGTVTSALTGLPIGGATVALGSRTTTTNGSGFYSFANLPAGTYPTDIASATGYDPSTSNNVAVTGGLTTTQNFSLNTPAASACPIDTTQADFQTGVPNTVDLTASPGDVVLTNVASINQQNTTLGTSGVGITVTTWGGQTFTPNATGQLTRADINLFCSGCTGTTPNLTLSVRATSGGIPTGADIASATITGFSSGAAVFYTGTFASPPTLTAGTQYALVIRPTANPSVGTYALTRSGTATAGADVYAGGTRVSGATSGTVWSIPLTGGVSTDAGFKVFMNTGFSASGDFVSSTKDSNPVQAGSTNWTSLSWTALVPAGTTLRFQAAASNNVNGPFNFVGPDGTAATFFTSSGASLSQFNGNRYLKYKAYLTTSSGAVSPTISDVTICYTSPRVWTGAVSSDWNNPANWSSSGVPGSGDAAIIPATGVTNNPLNTTSVSVASLQLGAGRIVDTGANTLTVNTCSPSAVTGGNSTSYVKGSLTRCVNNTGTYLFPVGTGTGYSPASLSGIVGSGTFNVKPNDGFLPGVLTTQSIQRNWSLTPISGVTQADITLTYLDADVPGTATESGFDFIRRSGATNTRFTPSSSNTATNTFTLNGVSSFSDWTLGALTPTAAGVSVSGRILKNDGTALRNAIVTLTGGNGNIRTARSNPFGYYRFEDVLVGEAYIISVSSKRYRFEPRIFSITDELTGVDFVALP